MLNLEAEGAPLLLGGVPAGSALESAAGPACLCGCREARGLFDVCGAISAGCAAAMACRPAGRRDAAEGAAP